MNNLDPWRASLGSLPGVRFVDFVYHAPDIDIADLPVTLGPTKTLLTFRATAAVVECISSSVEDDILTAGAVPGTGTWSVRVDGLDSNYREISETITLNGTAAVAGSLLFLRINNVEVVGNGTGKTNAGNITLRDASAGATRSYIVAGRGRAEIGMYTVPRDHRLLLDGWYMSARDASGASQADMDVREIHNFGAGPDHVAWSVTVDKVFQSPSSIPHEFPEGTDIRGVITYVAANNTLVDFHGHGLLISSNADV